MSMQFLQIENVGFWNSTEENKSWPFLKGKGTVKGPTRQSHLLGGLYICANKT